MKIGAFRFRRLVPLLVLCFIGPAYSISQEVMDSEDREWLGVIIRYHVTESLRLQTAQYLVSREMMSERSYRSEFGVRLKLARNISASAGYNAMPNPTELDRQTLLFALQIKSRLKKTNLYIRNRTRFDHSKGSDGYRDFLRHSLGLRYAFTKQGYGEISMEPFFEIGEPEPRFSRLETTAAVRYKLNNGLWFKPYYRYRKVYGNHQFVNYYRWGLQVGFPVLTKSKKDSSKGLAIQLRLHVHYTTKNGVK